MLFCYINYILFEDQFGAVFEMYKKPMYFDKQYWLQIVCSRIGKFGIFTSQHQETVAKSIAQGEKVQEIWNSQIHQIPSKICQTLKTFESLIYRGSTKFCQLWLFLALKIFLFEYLIQYRTRAFHLARQIATDGTDVHYDYKAAIGKPGHLDC